MAKKIKKDEGACSRRKFIKIGGAVAAGLQVGAVAGAGLAAGKDPSTHTGWQHLGDNTQFVDRTKLIRKGPAYETIGETIRPRRYESVFGRQGLIMRDMKQYREMIKSFDVGEDRQEGIGHRSDLPEKEVSPETSGGIRPPADAKGFPPVDAFKEPMFSYYKARPDLYELDKVRMEEILPKKRKDQEKYGDYYTLINAWSDSWSTHESITEPPEAEIH